VGSHGSCSALTTLFELERRHLSVKATPPRDASTGEVSWSDCLGPAANAGTWPYGCSFRNTGWMVSNLPKAVITPNGDGTRRKPGSDTWWGHPPLPPRRLSNFSRREKQRLRQAGWNQYQLDSLWTSLLSLGFVYWMWTVANLTSFPAAQQRSRYQILLHTGSYGQCGWRLSLLTGAELRLFSL